MLLPGLTLGAEGDPSESVTAPVAVPVPAFIRAQMPQARLVGRGDLTYMVWDVYDAELFAPAGHYLPDQPFALRLIYKRQLDGEKIAATSASEMRRQGFTDEAKLTAWQQQMTALFPNVVAGTSLTGLYEPGQPTCFFKDDEKTGCIKDAAFGPVFFNIWFGADTRAPALRQALLGLSTGASASTGAGD